MSKHPKADLYLEDRAKGMTYREIADKHGVSYQAVHTVCAKQGEPKRKIISSKACIYPNLRRWLNEDKQRQDRFFQAMKGGTFLECLKGLRQPKKNTIDKMIAITGMTYEELFAEEEY
jgi:hypothetical protein